MSINENRMELERLLSQYNLSSEDKEIIYHIVLPIFLHDEFQRRMNCKEFPHHGDSSLGSHIISDAIVSYLLTKNRKNKTEKDIELSTTIAMFHDLYENPWQNNERKAKNFIHKHGFTHPLEAAVNAYTWYPEYFDKLYESEIIIDSIVHHMWPFPVLTMNESVQLNNIYKYQNLPENIKQTIIDSSSRRCIKINDMGFISFALPKNFVVCISDKIVTINDDKLDIYDMIAFLGFKNYKLQNKTLVRKK